MHHPLPHSAHIHCLISINAQQVSMKDSGYHFLCMEEFHTFAIPYQTPFCQTAPLLLSVTRQQNVKKCWREGSTSVAIPPPSASDTHQHNKIGDITFEAALKDFPGFRAKVFDIHWVDDVAKPCPGQLFWLAQLLFAYFSVWLTPLGLLHAYF